MMSTAQMAKAFAAWPQVNPALHVSHHDHEYHEPVKVLDRLVDHVGENEKHPLASLIRQPGGLPENSRGLRSATMIPPVAIEIGRDPEWVAETGGILRAGKYCDSIRVVEFGGRVPGVSLRSTPGYFLTSLRGVRSHLAGWI